MSKETEQLKEEFDKWVEKEPMNDVGYTWDDIWQQQKKALNTQSTTLKKRIAEIPRIEITYKDGSKTRAILEHSLETHDMLTEDEIAIKYIESTIKKVKKLK